MRVQNLFLNNLNLKYICLVSLLSCLSVGCNPEVDSTSTPKLASHADNETSTPSPKADKHHSEFEQPQDTSELEPSIVLTPVQDNVVKESVDDEKLPSIISAVGKGSISEVENLIKSGASSIDTQDERDGETPLQEAVWAGNKAMVEFLLKQGANKDLRDHLGRTPLFIAASHGNKEIAETLIQAGADINIPDIEGWDEFSKKMRWAHTPLQKSVMLDYPEVADLLIQSKADLEIKSSSGQTALSLAIGYKKFAMMEKLMQAYADPFQEDDEGISILFRAEDGGPEYIAKIKEYIEYFKQSDYEVKRPNKTFHVKVDYGFLNATLTTSVNDKKITLSKTAAPIVICRLLAGSKPPIDRGFSTCGITPCRSMQFGQDGELFSVYSSELPALLELFQAE